MIIDLSILIICTIATVAAVRVFLIYGIFIISSRLNFSSKTKGQIIGYTTSVPELVVVISAALAGVFDAGFWNIASSNVINCFLFALAVLTYRQHKDLFNTVFIDEVVFVLLSVAIPLTMYGLGIDLTVSVSVGLLILFVVYKVIDRVVNRPAKEPQEEGEVHASLTKGLMALILGIAVIVVAGKYLGDSAHDLVHSVDMPAWLVGSILGFVTSIPELTSFFEIYRLEKKRKRLHLLDDTQQALDALVASNMSNLGIILPIGMIIYSLT